MKNRAPVSHSSEEAPVRTGSDTYYVGYGGGSVWRIRHVKKLLWRAYEGQHPWDMISGETLAEICEKLKALKNLNGDEKRKVIEGPFYEFFDSDTHDNRTGIMNIEEEMLRHPERFDFADIPANRKLHPEYIKATKAAMPKVLKDRIALFRKKD